MKFNVGDSVRFLNEKGEGRITRIINKNTVAVSTEDGFEIPFLISELVFATDGKQEKRQDEKPMNIPVPETTISERKKEKEGIYLAISPEHPQNINSTGFNFWLINHTSYEIMFVCSHAEEGDFSVFERGESQPWQTRIIATVAKKHLDDFANIKIEALFYNLKKHDQRPPISEVMKIKQARLYRENAFTETPLLSDKCLLLTVVRMDGELFFDSPENRKADLTQMFIEKQKAKQAAKISRPAIKNDSSYEMEIDLHIEELVDNYRGMSNAEIVVIQLRHFEAALDQAMNNHCRRLTVIHGVGNGRLKTEVRNILSAQGLRYHDASYAKYGFGATDVVF